MAAPRLVAIVGETASGKSAMAMELAARIGGEIICADSRTVYRYMDIGTAKPTADDRRRVPHHLLDVVDPDQVFTAADFKAHALKAAEEIRSRGNIPIMVGGSGLYVDAVLFDYDFRPPANAELRETYAEMGTDALLAEMDRQGLLLPENSSNPRHLIRVLETGGASHSRKPIAAGTIVAGLRLDRDELKRRIVARVGEMLAAGLIDEARELGARYGWDAPGLQAPAYKAMKEYLGGSVSLDVATQSFITRDVQLAKRQRTWFRRNNSIHWLHDPHNAVDFITTELSKIQ